MAVDPKPASAMTTTRATTAASPLVPSNGTTSPTDDPDEKMRGELPTTNHVTRNVNNNHSNNYHYSPIISDGARQNGYDADAVASSAPNAAGTERQLLGVRSVLLNAPNEVTFCDVSSTDSESDSYDEGADGDTNSLATTGTGSRRRRNHNNKAHQQRLSVPSREADVDSIMSSATKARPKPVIPDGGYGWIVVFSSLVVSLIADGISFSFGLLYTEFLIYFGESKSKTAWIGSIFLAVPLLSGPVMSNLVDKYGCRRMTIIGGVLSGIGFVMASFANSVVQLYWTFGVIGGLGLGIGYVTAVCSVVGWFDKRRTFATGIGASGTGIGTFLYAPLTQYLIETLGWRGTCLILAGTLFNICVCGALMRDPDWMIESSRLESRSQSMKTFSNSSVCLDEIKKMIDDGAPNEFVLDQLMTSYNTEVNQQLTDPSNSPVIKKYRSLLLLPTYLSPEAEDFSTDGPHKGNPLGSRRSLRRKPDEDIPLRDEMLSHTLPNADRNGMLCPPKRLSPGAVQPPPTYAEVSVLPRKSPQLASIETLNASEKFSMYDDERPLGAAVSEDDFLNDRPPAGGKVWSNDELELIGNSRMSLQDHQQRRDESDNDDDGDAAGVPRGRSVSAIYDNDNVRSCLLPLVDGTNNDVIIEIPTQHQLIQRNAASAKRKAAIIVNPADDTTALRRQTTLRNSHYLRNMRFHRNSIHYRGAMLSTHRYRLRASSCPNIYRNSMTTLALEEEETAWDSFKEILKSIFDFSLFLNPKFVFFEISSLLLFIWFIVPYFYLPEHMKSLEYSEDDSAFVISVIGVSQTVGMIGLGFIGDQPWLNVPKTYACCLVGCGLAVALIPFVAHSYIALCIVGGLFGFMFASSFSFTPIILVQLVSLDDFTCAYGLVLLIQGVGNLVGPPIAGIMYEIFGVWDHAFYFGGFFIAVAGGFVFVTGILQDRDRDDDEEDSIDA